MADIFFGSFRRGSVPVALFAGPRLSGLQVVRRRPTGFGGEWSSGPCEGLDSETWEPTDPNTCTEIAPGGSDDEPGWLDRFFGWASEVDWEKVIKAGFQATEAGLKLYQQAKGEVPRKGGGTISNEELVRMLAARSSTPAWVLPAAIAGGVVVIGGVLFALLRQPAR